MPNDFEALIAEMEEAGLDPDYIDRLQKATAASPIRKERDAYKEQAQAHLDRAQKAEAKALAHSFRELGITMKPSALRMPDDLDITDDEKLRAWATEAGLIQAPQSLDASMSADERQAHANMANASVGALGTPAPNSTESINAAIAAANSPEEVMAIVMKAGLPVPQQ